MRTKALQWQKTSDTVLCWAHTVLGSYRVWKIGADGEWDWSFEGYDTRETFIGKVPTEEAAKLAAQSHFDAAIASVLEDDGWERKRAIAAIHWVFNADGTVGERAMAQEAIHKINDPTFMPSPPKAGE